LLEIISNRCCGRSPSGPPDEPAGNDLIALVTSVTRVFIYLFIMKIVHEVHSRPKHSSSIQ